MSPASPALLLQLAVLLAATVESSAQSCRPPCSLVLAELDRVTRWCVAPLGQPSAQRAVESVMRCVDTHMLQDSPPPLGLYDVLVGTSPGYELLAGADSVWSICKADRIGSTVLSHAYFGAVWNASHGACPGNYSVWVTTFQAPPCWQHNASDHLRPKPLDERELSILRKEDMYQCTHCHIPGHYKNITRTDKYIVMKQPKTVIFQYQSCNETNVKEVPSLSPVYRNSFRCEVCLPWIKIFEEALIEYVDCDEERKSKSRSTTPAPGSIIRECKKKWVHATTLQPSTISVDNEVVWGFSTTNSAVNANMTYTETRDNGSSAFTFS